METVECFGSNVFVTPIVKINDGDIFRGKVVAVGQKYNNLNIGDDVLYKREDIIVSLDIANVVTHAVPKYRIFAKVHKLNKPVESSSFEDFKDLQF